MAITYSEEEYKSAVCGTEKCVNSEGKKYERTRIPLGFCSAYDDIHDFAESVDEAYLILERLKGGEE